METRYNSDACRQIKRQQQASDPGRYIMNVPGLGEYPSFIQDPYIIPQKWGGNLRTNSINLDSELRGVNRQLNKDCLGKDEYQRFQFQSKRIIYPTNYTNITDQSRAITPAWEVRDLEQVDWYHLPLNPQENTCIPFLNNLNTRILEKDYFVAKVPCNLSNYYTPLPSSSMTHNNVNDIDSCQKINHPSKVK
jgi:hypothetical protein